MNGDTWPKITQTSLRKPVFFKIPMNWKELTDEEKDAWSLQLLDKVIGAADPEDRRKLEDQDGSGVGQS
jgi:hypothetical protein